MILLVILFLSAVVVIALLSVAVFYVGKIVIEIIPYILLIALCLALIFGTAWFIARLVT